jgi:hypothetical protein
MLILIEDWTYLKATAKAYTVSPPMDTMSKLLKVDDSYSDPPQTKVGKATHKIIKKILSQSFRLKPNYQTQNP